MPDTRRVRTDLLHTLELWQRQPPRQVSQVGRWRVRSLDTHAIAARSNWVAAELERLGVQPGDRVALYLEDGPLWHAAFFGVLRLGAVAVPLDPTVPAPLLRQVSDHLGARAWVTEGDAPQLDLDAPKIALDWSRNPPAATGGRPLPDPDPSRVAQIVLTSGTSGTPHAVPVTHANLMAVLEPVAREVERYHLALAALPAARLAVALPLSHLYGQVMGVFLPAVLNAHTFLLPTLQAADLARVLRRERIQVLSTVPRTLALLSRYLVDEGALSMGTAGFELAMAASDTMPWYRRPLVFRRVRARLGRRLVAVICGGAALDLDVELIWRRLGYVVVQGYGLTEAAPLVTLNHPFRTKAGSLGRPLHGVHIRLAEDGEILVRGANVVRAGATQHMVDPQGWLHTGDLGRYDTDDNRLYYVGRKGDRIVTPAGVNVDPAPIAAALRLEEGVLDALVIERPWGNRGTVTAVMLLRPGADGDAVVSRVNAALPDAARIRSWHSWPSGDLPRTHTGKIKCAEVKGWVATLAPQGAQLHDTAAAPPAPVKTITPSGPAVPKDAYTHVVALIGEVTGADLATLDRQTPLADALTSIDRVELAALLERTYSVTLSEAAFAGERSIGELAGDFAALGRGDDGDLPAQLGGAPPAPRRSAELSGVQDEASATLHEATARPPAIATASQAGDAPFPEFGWRNAGWARAARFAIREWAMQPIIKSIASIRSEGVEHIEAPGGPVIIAANHLSILDPPTILFALPRRLRGQIAPSAMWQHYANAKTGLWQLRWSVLGLNMIPLVQVGDWRPTLRLAGQLVDWGYSPLIFPEGKRSEDGRPDVFRLGVGVLAAELRLPIVPCAIAGLHEVLPRGARWPRSAFIPRAPVAVVFGAALAPPKPGEEVPAVVEELKTAVEHLHNRAVEISGRY